MIIAPPARPASTGADAVRQCGAGAGGRLVCGNARRVLRDQCQRRAGFTLVEVTFALALIALITALALPRILPNFGSTALRIKAFEVAALLRADRDAALRTGRTVATLVNLADRRVWSGASGGSVTLPDHWALRLASAAPEGFRFYPDGSASGGELILAKGSAALAVRVEALTAAVAIRRQDIGHGG